MADAEARGTAPTPGPIGEAPPGGRVDTATSASERDARDGTGPGTGTGTGTPGPAERGRGRGRSGRSGPAGHEGTPGQGAAGQGTPRQGAAGHGAAGQGGSGGSSGTAGRRRGGGEPKPAGASAAISVPDATDADRPKVSRGRPWVPGLAAVLVLIAGAVNILSAVTPEWRDRLDEIGQVLPGALSRQAAAATVVAGVLLLLLSRGLKRRKRRAWRTVVVVLATSVVLHVVKGLDYEEAALAFALLVALVAARGEFQAKGDPTTRWRALWVGLMLVATSVAIGLVLLHAQPRRMVGDHPLSAQLEQVLLGLAGIRGPLTFRGDRFEDLVIRVLFAMGLTTAITVTYLALRPPRRRPQLTGEDTARMRALLERHGDRDSLGYFALRSDKSVIWSPTGKSCIAYRVVSGVMLASGDPLGDNEAWPGAIKEFLREAGEHAWTPAVIGCSEPGGTAYCRAGLSALEFGDEAVIDIPSFSLDGRAMRNVRQAVARAERSGYTTVTRRVRDMPPDELTELRDQARAWRDTETERGFSMALGRCGGVGDDECVVVACHDGGTGGAKHGGKDGGKGGGKNSGRTEADTRDDPVAEPRLRAFLHFVPWGKDGLSLELMRRDKTADNGLNELLIVSALRACPDLGVKRMSLNFAFFRSALERGERLGAGPVMKAWRNLLVFLSRWFQIDSLYRFNAKFRPQWYPRFICYPATRDLPRIALAMLEAEAFLVWPHLGLPRLPRLSRLRRPGAAVLDADGPDGCPDARQDGTPDGTPDCAPESAPVGGGDERGCG